MNLSLMPRSEVRLSRRPRASVRYSPPRDVGHICLSELLQRVGRPEEQNEQLDLLRRGESTSGKDILIHFSGDLSILSNPCVSIVGTRDVSEAGRNRAAWLAARLSEAGVSIVSGLAKGVDTAAHTATIDVGGKTVAVIGTPISKAYPAENARLQEMIYREHLLVSPFDEGQVVFKSNFPARNRLMAAISDATVIIEASDTSGTLHQAVECTRLKRWLFIAEPIVADPTLKWPQSFLSYERAVVLSKVSDILSRIAK